MYSVVFVTCRDKKQARAIASALVRERLAACATILDGVQSVFRWQGKVEVAREVMLLIKTKKSAFAAVAARIKALHSYEVPEIIALPVQAGERAYLRWIDDCCRKPA